MHQATPDPSPGMSAPENLTPDIWSDILSHVFMPILQDQEVGCDNLYSVSRELAREFAKFHVLRQASHGPVGIVHEILMLQQA